MKHSREEILNAYEKIKNMLQEAEDFSDSRKEGLRNLFTYLEEETEWMTAPCSTRYHCSYKGGLLEHSVNVASLALKMQRVLMPKYSAASVVMVAILHDCGKHCQYYQQEPTPKQVQYGYEGSWRTRLDIPYMGHEDRSAWLVTQYIPDITEEEFSAIVLHNEPWLTSTCQFQNCPLATLIQNCDYWCCMYIEDRD